MYEPSRKLEPGGCREVWTLTCAAFAVLLPLILAMLGILGAVAAVFFLLAVHPALALLPLAGLIVGIYVYARWERDHSQPPDP